MKPVVPLPVTVARTEAHTQPDESRPVAVVEIDTVFQAVGAYRVLHHGLIEPGSQRYEALVQQANRVVAEALERVRHQGGYAHIMVAPVMAHGAADDTVDVTTLVVREVAMVEHLAWQRRRTSRPRRRAA